MRSKRKLWLDERFISLRMISYNKLYTDKLKFTGVYNLSDFIMHLEQCGQREKFLLSQEFIDNDSNKIPFYLKILEPALTALMKFVMFCIQFIQYLA